MAQTLSAFGYVLTWVRNKLEQVEGEMSSQNANGDITAARQGIDELLFNDESLGKVKAAKSEYEELVDNIQNREPELSENARNIGHEIHDRFHQ